MGMADCGHSFCSDCIQQWVKECSGCPICRAEITKIRLHYRHFFLGDEIPVTQKQQCIPIPDDVSDSPSHLSSDSTDDFISEEIVYSSEASSAHWNQAAGTTWNLGHRESLRLRHPRRVAGIDQFRYNLAGFRNQRQVRDLLSTADGLANSEAVGGSEARRFVADGVRGLLRSPARRREPAFANMRLERD
jgi:hypothetical protein